MVLLSLLLATTPVRATARPAPAWPSSDNSLPRMILVAFDGLDELVVVGAFGSSEETSAELAGRRAWRAENSRDQAARPLDQLQIVTKSRSFSRLSRAKRSCLPPRPTRRIPCRKRWYPLVLTYPWNWSETAGSVNRRS